ncbi:hypothetical protein GDO86_000045 [Hymenochirus boettgeri]|uniref:Ig-like domain-containing protein n=1 Tax=Hymenochirus boettgeri TaxID=247094 RepID=A0A8T2KAI0_9PIPI|nr:hypothetical protein GDO86_000045 [Hymenochirus boettgeri]
MKLLLLCLVLGGWRVQGSPSGEDENIYGLKGELADFPCNYCSAYGDLYFLGSEKNRDSKTFVLYWEGDIDHVDRKYMDRIGSHNNGNVSLSGLTEEDGGWYQWDCDGKPNQVLYLHVCEPITNVTVLPSADGLHCNFTGTSLSVTWRMNNQSVTDYSLMSGDNRTLLVPQDGRKCGDYTCHVLDVRNRMHSAGLMFILISCGECQPGTFSPTANL